jgi:hypothetical protein
MGEQYPSRENVTTEVDSFLSQAWRRVEAIEDMTARRLALEYCRHRPTERSITISTLDAAYSLDYWHDDFDDQEAVSLYYPELKIKDATGSLAYILRGDEPTICYDSISGDIIGDHDTDYTEVMVGKLGMMQAALSSGSMPKLNRHE